MRIEFVAANPRHVADLLEHMRDKDRAAFAKLHGSEIERIVETEIANSVFAWAGLADGRCGALWGIKMAGMLSSEGTLWMLGGDFVDRHPIAFLRHSRRQLLALRGFSKLYGCVLTDYAESRRWLEWLGFEIGPDQGGICSCEYRFG